MPEDSRQGCGYGNLLEGGEAMTADECEFCHMGYCCPPNHLVKAGFVCPDALPMEEGDITNKCPRGFQ